MLAHERIFRLMGRLAYPNYFVACIHLHARSDSRLIRLFMSAFLVIPVAVPSEATTREDYPTSEVVDYVLGCMRVNGETRESLESCSCSFDVLASIIPYERYLTAETARRMTLVQGQQGSLYRNDVAAKAAVTDLRRAQAEAELRCFH